MPLHLESFVTEERGSTIFETMLAGIRSANPRYFSKDRTIFHAGKPLKDAITGKEFGSIVYTFQYKIEDDDLEIIGVDMVLHNDHTARLQFLNKLPKSTDANEYYDAEVVGQGGHLQLETVNRLACEEEILDTEREVYLSAFPFTVAIYEDMEAFNQEFGLEREVGPEGSKIKCYGLSEDFMCPASLTQMGVGSDETYTYFFCRVKSIREVRCEDFEETLEFLIVEADSGMGVLPLIMSRECFDLRDLAVGKVLEVRADIKADFGERSREKNYENE